MLIRSFAPFPILATERLILRQLVIDDVQEIFILRSDREINKYLDRKVCNTIDDARDFINMINENISRNDSIYWAITLGDENILVGTICLFSFSDEDRRCEIGYELLTGFQGQGIMKEAAEKVIDYAFNTVGVQKIEAIFHRDNQRSVNLLEKLLFKKSNEFDMTNSELICYQLRNPFEIMRGFKTYFLLTMAYFFMGIAVSGQTNKKIILGIFSHPDDENMIGHVLAKYARLGHNVYIIIATDGKYGTRVTQIPAGDSLGQLRQRESECACEKLKINPPIYLHIERLDTKFGVRPYLNSRKKAMQDIKSHIERLKPDVLLTFGPDGEYGHSEHIVTGAIVTDILLTEGWVEKYPLYFPVDIKEDVADNTDLSYIDKKYINLKVEYSDEDEQLMIEAAKCYVTQFTPNEIKDLIDVVTKDKANTKYFRKFIVGQEKRAEFWD